MIRKFDVRDMKRILQIEKDSFPKTFYDKHIFSYLSRCCEFLVYESTREGIMGYTTFDPKDGHLISIAVDLLHRRRGIGKSLMEEVLKSCKRVWLEVRRSNTVAQSFYEKLGFVKTGILSNYYGDEDALVMAREQQ
jgi:ribosomal-protein-alanine N-acetyltransferase